MCILKEVTRANFEKSAVTVCAAGTNTSKCFWVAIWKTVVVEWKKITTATFRYSRFVTNQTETVISYRDNLTV